MYKVYICFFCKNDLYICTFIKHTRTVMGIPSYFSYLVRNYPHVLSLFSARKQLIDNLYLDCNSIIYDAYNSQAATSICPNKIIDDTVQKINNYISVVNPQKTVFIAFDGVAPVAKIEQQRARRFKSWYQNNMKQKISKLFPDDNKEIHNAEWSSLAITPGTEFMKNLDARVKQAFLTSSSSLSLSSSGPQIIVSGSDETGEGEHKLFDYIRKHPGKHKDETTVIYGLDADLIVLSILYTDVCKQIYLLRESPHFYLENLEPNQLYLLNINSFARLIDINKYDYIVLTFLLGNDFLPHFPSVNIRTGGMDKLLLIYNMLFAKGKKSVSNLTLVSSAHGGQRRICWPRIHQLFHFLSKKEHEYFKEEHNARIGFAQKLGAALSEETETPETMWKRFEYLPIHDRAIEQFINPLLVGWQYRYYATLFPNMEFVQHEFVQTQINIQKIVKNYCDGLEWVFNYYVDGCSNWKWSYNHNYAPLFEDLYAVLNPHISSGDVNISSPLVFYKTAPVSSKVQLCKVLPRDAFLKYFPDKTMAQNIVDVWGDDWFPNQEMPFLWAYCRYFWESHPLLPTMDLYAVEKIMEHVDNNN